MNKTVALKNTFTNIKTKESPKWTLKYEPSEKSKRQKAKSPLFDTNFQQLRQ